MCIFSNPYLQCILVTVSSHACFSYLTMPQTPLTIRPTLLPSASDSIPSHPEENIHFDDDGGPGHRFHRDAYTGSDSDSDSGDSEATLDVIDVYQFGHPLERMCRLENTSETPMFRSRVSSPACSSVSNSSVGSSSFGDRCVHTPPKISSRLFTTASDGHSIYEALVDRLLIQNPSFGTSDASNEVHIIFDIQICNSQCWCAVVYVCAVRSS